MKYPMGRKGVQLGLFIKTKLYGVGGNKSCERVSGEITNFHLLRWCATKVLEKW